ncbi:hypothetical protein Tco_0835247 [Tanacetum coccineum]
MGHFARECRAPRSKDGQFRYQDNSRNKESPKRTEDISSKAMLAIEGVGFNWKRDLGRRSSSRQTWPLMANFMTSEGNPQIDDKGFVDSGCSRHMTGNIAYLSDFKEFDGGYVTFGGGAYGALEFLVFQRTLKTECY